jgi:outer membrane protein assembly factor BamB
MSYDITQLPPSRHGNDNAISTMSSENPVAATRRSLLRALGGGLLTAAMMTSDRTLAQARQPPPVATPAALGPAIPPEVARFAADWPAPQGNLAGHRAAAASPITAANAGQLEVAWSFPLTASSGYGAMTANPIVAGDTVYVQDMESNVFALDRATGNVVWQRDYRSPTAGGNGVAIGYGLVFAAIGLSAEMFALDAATGDEVWRVKLSANPAEFIFMPPLVYDNVVYVSTSPGAYVPGSRGIFFALDARSGAVLWQWDTTTDNLWGSARRNSGGGVWYPPSVDEQGNLYFGTGNPAPWPEFTGDPGGTTRPGPNLYSSSMVSLDPATGALRWSVQAAPHDVLDHDFQHTPILADVAHNGAARLLAIGAGKTGTVIAADAGSGEVVWEASVGAHNAYGDGEPLPQASATPVTVLPGFFGGVLTPMAFAGDTIFAPVIDLPFTYTDTTADFDLATATGEMVALDVATGAVRWRSAVDTFFCGGATVANDVVFGAGLDGIVRGFDTGSGREVWRYQAGAGINAPAAIAGDTLLVPAGGPLLTALATPPPARNELIAFRLSGEPPSEATATAAPREASHRGEAARRNHVMPDIHAVGQHHHDTNIGFAYLRGLARVFQSNQHMLAGETPRGDTGELQNGSGAARTIDAPRTDVAVN